MYSTKLRGGKASAAEQKLHELKKLFLRSKRMKKFERVRVKSNKLIKKATFNLNNIVSPKYGFAPQDIEIRALIKTLANIFKRYTIFIDFGELKKLI